MFWWYYVHDILYYMYVASCPPLNHYIILCHYTSSMCSCMSCYCMASMHGHLISLILHPVSHNTCTCTHTPVHAYAVVAISMVLPDFLCSLPLGDRTILLWMADCCRTLPSEWRSQILHLSNQLGVSDIQCLCHLGCNCNNCWLLQGVRLLPTSVCRNWRNSSLGLRMWHTSSHWLLW